MKTRKIIVALVGAFIIATAMTGLAAAVDEQMEILQDGAPPDVGLDLDSPFILKNDGVTPNNLDLKIWDYLPASPAGQGHTLILTINPVSGVADANDITITATERTGPGAPRTATGTGTVTLTWNQDVGGNTGFDYIDVALVSSGLDGATYQLNIDDTGYGTVGEAIDCTVENIEITNVPEFATIAIPVAAILGLVLFFNHRKHKKE